MKRTNWIIGGLAVLSLVAVAAVAQPEANDEDVDEVELAGPGQMRGPGMGGPGPGPMMRMGRRRAMGEGGGPGGGMMMRRLMELDLSTEQATRVRGIMRDAQKQVIPKQADIRVRQLEMRQILEQAQPNTRQVETLVGQIADIEKDVKLIMLRAHMQARGVLTAEQLEKFLDPSWHPARVQSSPAPDTAPMRRGMRNR